MSKNLSDQIAAAEATLQLCKLPQGPGVASNEEVLTITVEGLIAAIKREDQ